MANVMTPEFRVSYPKVFKIAHNKLKGVDEYSLIALFAKGADLSALKNAALEAIKEKWGQDQAKWPKPLKTPFRDQGEKEKDGVLPPGHEKGAIFMNLTSKQKPGVVDQNVQPIIDETQFYGGCYARATVRAHAYSKGANNGVTFYLVNVQKLRDGDTFGNQTKPEQDFKPVEGASLIDAPTTGTDIFS